MYLPNKFRFSDQYAREAGKNIIEKIVNCNLDTLYKPNNDMFLIFQTTL